MSAESDLQQLIASQAKLTQSLTALMARNPAIEFGNVEGYVGSTKNFLPCPKLQGVQLIAPEYGAAKSIVVVGPSYIQRWKFFHKGFINILVLDQPGLNFMNSQAVQIEFGNDLNFRDPSICIVPYDLNVIYSSVTAGANSGEGVCSIAREFEIQKRYMRITSGRLAYNNSSQPVTGGRFLASNATGGSFDNSLPFLVECYGE